MGAILVLAASPAVATRIGLDSFHMVRQHYVMLPVAFAVVLGVSMLSPRQVRRLGVRAVPAVPRPHRADTRSMAPRSRARRAGSRSGRSRLQPSEFLKPTFAIFAAWMFSLKMSEQRVPGNLIAIAAYRAGGRRPAEAARPRHDRGHHRDLVRAVLRRRPALHLGHPAGRPRRRRPGRRLFHVLPCARARGPVPEGHRRLLPDRPRAGGVPERRALSAAGRAKARSSWCCPTRIPISSSPSPARNSA